MWMILSILWIITGTAGMSNCVMHNVTDIFPVGDKKNGELKY
jgi:hypothetical protein